MWGSPWAAAQGALGPNGCLGVPSPERPQAPLPSQVAGSSCRSQCLGPEERDLKMPNEPDTPGPVLEGP